ncbi:MAG: DUF1080 domain-containing protein [Akkermansiaceae bacterium]|nr:DUF1080 domain-containing protein [Akkermansiaceae bacterium]MDP4779834.1 DUF1080 domain-containing protein [Akkermansiaceae bacterium]
MKLIPIFLTALFTASAFAEEAESGFVPLFDGKTTEGWVNPYKWGKIAVVDGEIHLTAEQKFFLLTEKEYSNFIFEGEVHLPEGKANSGFLFRAQIGDKGAFGYQAEVDGDPTRGWSGGFYDEGRRKWFVSPIKGDAESEAAFKARAGDTFKRNGWNTYRITCKDDHITIEVNGVVTSDVHDAEDAKGFIGIQHHGEKGATYRFRNLRIKELE